MTLHKAECSIKKYCQLTEDYWCRKRKMVTSRARRVLYLPLNQSDANVTDVIDKSFTRRGSTLDKYT